VEHVRIAVFQGGSSRSMGILNFEDLQPGMVLADDIKDRNGMVLLGRGRQVTEKDLRTLMMWGVTEADVDGIDREEVISRAAAQFDPQLLVKAEEGIRERFRHTDPTHPFVKELIRLLTLRAVRQSSGEGGHDS
jgi:hypothetical protein